MNPASRPGTPRLGLLALALVACTPEPPPAPTAPPEEVAETPAPEPVPAPRVSDEDRARALELFREARVARTEGRAQESSDLLRRAIELDPTNGTAHLRLGQVLVHLSDVVVGTPTRDKAVLAEACAVLARAVELQPEVPEPYVWLAEALALDGRYAEAIERLREALRVEPDHPEATRALAIALTQDHQFQAAKETLRAAIALLPKDADLHFRLGQELEADGDVLGARKAYERSIELDWTVPAPHSKLAVVLGMLGDADGAERERTEHRRWMEYGRRLRAARLEALANKTRTASTLAFAAMLREARLDASAWLRNALAGEGTPAETFATHVLSAAVAEEAGEAELAEQHRAAAAKLLRAAGEDPSAPLALADDHVRADDHAARLVLAGVLLEAGWPGLARERFQALVAEAPGLAEARQGYERARAEESR